MKLLKKLEILADAAKYDASCASSGAEKRNSRGSGGIGSTQSMGICHSYAPDGRCISLLKLLLTNFCVYECSYCVNRASSNVPRARFTVDEVVYLTMEFYKRNYIEGLFLSSGIIQDADYTMEQLVAVARKLRVEERFGGYIHLKTIPEASPELLADAGLYADRLSINVELPTGESLRQLAPEKNAAHIEHTMLRLRDGIEAYRDDRKLPAPGRAELPKFAPAGQSTQMIVGADAAEDRTILLKADKLYQNYSLKRVYYSAFSPIPDASKVLPLQAAPLQREHRLYQADWLLRVYGFSMEELNQAMDARTGMLDADIDPKLAWALHNRHLFPVDVNRADYETLLRIPGVGLTSAKRIVAQRRSGNIRLDDLKKMRLPLSKLKPFVQTLDYHPAGEEAESGVIKRRLTQAAQAQLSLF